MNKGEVNSRLYAEYVNEIELDEEERERECLREEEEFFADCEEEYDFDFDDYDLEPIRETTSERYDRLWSECGY